MLNIYYRVCLLALCLLFLVSCNKLSENSSICGNWDGIYNCHEISFVFNCLNKCTLKYLNNKSNKIEVINGNYELDFSKKPTLLSIRNISQLNYSIYTIIEFPDKVLPLIFPLVLIEDPVIAPVETDLDVIAPPVLIEDALSFPVETDPDVRAPVEVISPAVIFGDTVPNMPAAAY